MSKVLWFLCCPIFFSSVYAHQHLQLNFKITIGHGYCRDYQSLDCQKIKNWIKNEISQLEALFGHELKLKVNAEMSYLDRVGDTPLDLLNFNEAWERSLFMRSYFRNLVYEEGGGAIQILIVEDVYVGGRRSGGSSSLPLDPFRYRGSTRGILIAYRDYEHCDLPTRGTFAHEFGHFLGIRHTFTAVDPLGCNTQYPHGELGKGMSRRSDGSINVLDYRRTTSRLCPRPLYLDQCQIRHAHYFLNSVADGHGGINYKRFFGMIKTKRAQCGPSL